MKGFDLRARVDSFGDVLTEVGAFLDEMDVEDSEDLLVNARDALDRLFYLIPLEDKREEPNDQEA